jgi:flagellin
MAMVVKNNMSAISTLNTLNKNSSALTKSLAKVSSGMKINGAADDASGYAISERMRVQIRSLDQANANTQNGSSMMKTAEGAVSSTVDILKTLKEKVIGAANDDKTDSDRAAIQKELDQSIDQINDNANITYNGKYLVDGSHNQRVQQTTTSMTNESLNSSTNGKTSFTDMTDRNGNSLNIQNLETVNISFVREGSTYTTSMQLKGSGKNSGNENLEGLLKLANKEYARQLSTDSVRTIMASDNAVGSNATESAIMKDALIKAGYTYSAASNEWQKEGADSIASAYVDKDGKIGASATAGITNWSTGAITDGGLFNKLSEIGTDNKDLKAVLKALDDEGYTYKNGSWQDNDNHKIAGSIIDETGYMGASASAAATGFSSGAEALLADVLDQAVIGNKAQGNAFQSKVSDEDYIGRDVAGDSVYTADRGNALTIKAGADGVDNQISGITITVTNTNGQQQKSVNAVLDNFSESIRAQNKSDDNAITLQVGAKAGQSIRVGLTDMRAQALGLQSKEGKTIQIGTQTQANAAINVLDNAVQKALDQQTTIGAIESRLEYTSTNLTTSSENVQSSESTIRDADMAKEMTEYTKNNVLLQAAQSMLAQANQNSSAVLSLLQ